MIAAIVIVAGLAASVNIFLYVDRKQTNGGNAGGNAGGSAGGTHVGNIPVPAATTTIGFGQFSDGTDLLQVSDAGTTAWKTYNSVGVRSSSFIVETVPGAGKSLALIGSEWGNGEYAVYKLPVPCDNLTGKSITFNFSISTGDPRTDGGQFMIGYYPKNASMSEYSYDFWHGTGVANSGVPFACVVLHGAANAPCYVENWVGDYWMGMKNYSGYVAFLTVNGGVTLGLAGTNVAISVHFTAPGLGVLECNGESRAFYAVTLGQHVKAPDAGYIYVAAFAGAIGGTVPSVPLGFLEGAVLSW